MSRTKKELFPFWEVIKKPNTFNPILNKPMTWVDFCVGCRNKGEVNKDLTYTKQGVPLCFNCLPNIDEILEELNA